MKPLTTILILLTLATLSLAESHHLPPGQTLTLTADLLLEGNNTLDLSGTPDQPCIIDGQNHQIRTAPAWKGQISITHTRINNLGTAQAPAIDVNAAGEASITIDHSRFDACGAVTIFNGGNSTTRFTRNTLLDTSLVPVDKDINKSKESFLARGNSPAPKFFQGNRIYKAHVQFDSPHWLIGGDSDADSNLLIGHRVKIVAAGNTSIIRGNYLHVLMPRNEQFPYWSQVSTLQPAGNLVEHNIIRDGEWIVQLLTGEFRYNIVCDINDHNLMRNYSAGSVHHNIFFVGKPQHPPGSMFACISVIYPPREGQDGMEIYNNTFDGCGIFEPPGIDVCEKGVVKSLRNNLFMNLKLTKYYKLPAAVIRPSWQEEQPKDPARLLYADYNAFFNPQAKDPKNYTLTVPNKTLRKDPGFAQHDLPANGPVDAQLNPKLQGPLLTEFPFTDAEIVTGKISVSQMLNRFRTLYKPSPASPLIDAGDPADGAGTDIGAVGAGKPNSQDQFGLWPKEKGTTDRHR
jgi:hypothetical protein